MSFLTTHLGYGSARLGLEPSPLCLPNPSLVWQNVQRQEVTAGYRGAWEVIGKDAAGVHKREVIVTNGRGRLINDETY